MSPRTLTTQSDQAGERLDKILASAWPDLSRSRIQALIRAGQVSVGGQEAASPSLRVSADATVELVEPEPVAATPRPEVIPLDIVFEDDHLLVLDKPAGLTVHPGAGNEHGTLVNALLHHCSASLSGIGGVIRPGIVHRLDKDTSGLLVVAKTDRVHRALSEQFADHGRTGPLERAYLAFVWGTPESRAGTVDAAIGRSPTHRERMKVVPADRGRAARTHYAVEQVYGPAGEPAASLVRCTLETGRTHQIRVHMAHLKHPLIGDAVYGSGFTTKINRLPEALQPLVGGLGRQALHAALLQFAHPVTAEVMRFESALPPDLAQLRSALGEDVW